MTVALSAFLAGAVFSTPLYSAEQPDAMMRNKDQTHQNEPFPAAEIDYKDLLSQLETAEPGAGKVILARLLALGRIKLEQRANKQALEILGGLYKMRPDIFPLALNYAVALLADGQYKESIAFFEKAVALDKSFEPRARYYMGLAKYLSGDTDGGIEDLAKASGLAARSYEGRRADRLLAQLEEIALEGSGMKRQIAVATVPGKPTKEKPWALSLTAGMEYDTNVALIPAEQTRPSDISSDSDWRAVYSLGGVYEFVNTGKHFLGVQGNIYGTQQFKNEMFNVQNGTLNLYYKANIADSFQVRLSPFVGKTLLKTASYSWLYGITPGVSWQPVDWTWTDLDYTYSKVDFTEPPQYPEENRSGKNHNVTLRQNLSFPNLLMDQRTTFFAGWLNYNRSDTDGSSYANHSEGFGVLSQQEFPMDFTLLVSYNYTKNKYDNPNIRSANNDKRDDTSHLVTANVFKKLDMLLKNLSAYVGYRWFKNDSNIAKYYSYISNTYSAGFTMNF